MAFTMVLAADGRTILGIVCDHCNAVVGKDGRVIWGRQVTDDDGPLPFTSVSAELFVGGGADIPYSVLVACSEDCRTRLPWLYADDPDDPDNGSRGLGTPWMSVRDYVAWLVVMELKIDVHAVALAGMAGASEPSMPPA